MSHIACTWGRILLVLNTTSSQNINTGSMRLLPSLETNTLLKKKQLLPVFEGSSHLLLKVQ